MSPEAVIGLSLNRCPQVRQPSEPTRTDLAWAGSLSPGNTPPPVTRQRFACRLPAAQGRA